MTSENADPQLPDDPRDPEDIEDTEDTEGMTGRIRVTVLPPSPTGARRVRVDGEILGLAHNLADITEFLRRAGLDLDPTEVAQSPWINWQGTPPNSWNP
ncbi:hypothetical protein ACFVGN_19440 [Streptomyces sp. NPDC057757]|uniref:hypothetical protein n=1 Tax=Streptomyces sp. NPDC057757 TaxID=3346241 RepID=UPI00367980B4